MIADAIAEVTTLSFCHKYNTSLLTPRILLHVFADASLKAYGAVDYIQGSTPCDVQVKSNSTQVAHPARA